MPPSGVEMSTPYGTLSKTRSSKCVGTEDSRGYPAVMVPPFPVSNHPTTSRLWSVGTSVSTAVDVAHVTTRGSCRISGSVAIPV
jgi:hypothetical protein